MIPYKKNILASVFLCLFSIVSGTTYYVSSTGNDAANGLTESTSWRTIAKVNSFSFKAGDMIYFKRGDLWNETLIPSSSGTSSNRITFGAYGIGAKPVFSGFTTVSGWTNYGGGIYSKAVSCKTTPRMVTVGGVNQRMGRWPKLAKADYNMYDSFSGTTQITDSELNGHNWTGGNVVVRINLSYMKSSYISGHSGSTITFSGGSTMHSGYGYFINNHIGTLTELGEWCVTGTAPNFTLYMYFGSANPKSYTVKIASHDYGANLSGRSFITLDGLTFEGFNDGIYTSSSSYLTIQNCTINFMGDHGIRFGLPGTSHGGGGSYNVVDNNTISDCNNMGIEMGFWREFSYCTVKNNVLKNIGSIPGMGQNMYQSYGGIRLWAEHSLAQYNSLTNIGYHGIAFYGNGTSVRNNFVNTFCTVKSDGGGIYSVQQGEPVTTGSEVTNNIVINGIGIDPKYSDYLGWAAMGIYLDDRMTNVLVDGNTVWNCSGDGIYLHGAINIKVTNNIVGGCGKNTGHHAQLRSSRDFKTEPPSTGLVITGNQFISLATSNPNKACQLQYAAIFQANGGTSEIKASISSANNNYYAMPLFPNSGNLVRLWEGSYGVTATWKTLAEWKSYSGKDANSNISKVTITNINQAQIIYNETKVNKIVTLDAGYVDVTGKKYSGSITLLPYTSAILMLDPNPSAAPASPIYVSSAIEDATPNTLEMTYNLSLAMIIPGTSSFSVTVNSLPRSVSTVSISGTKVLLTLASPVVFGDIVTVGYTKAATNPLQTESAGLAATITALTVTNRVSNPATLSYINSAVGNSSPTLLEINYNLPLANFLPEVSAFIVRVNTVRNNVNSIAITGNSVVLTLATEVLYSDVVTVAYTKPATNPLQSSSGLQAATMSAQSVTNKVIPVGPVYVSSVVENIYPSIIEITYNEPLDLSVPRASSFVVMVNGVRREVTSVIPSGNKIKLTLASPIVYGDDITISYLKPAINPLKKPSGETAVSFSSPQPVKNNLFKKGKICVYPNPARENINISINEPCTEKQIIKIFDFTGKLCMETILDPFVSTIRIPISLKSGVYIVQGILGSITSFTQKVIVAD